MVTWECQPCSKSQTLILKQTQCVVLTRLIIKFHKPHSCTHKHIHNMCLSPWGSHSERWKTPSVTHRSHNLSWHRRTALPTETCGHTHTHRKYTHRVPGQGSRLPLSFRVIYTKQWRGSRKALSGMVNNRREWEGKRQYFHLCRLFGQEYMKYTLPYCCI